MTRQFMVRILRDGEADDYADVVVDADSEGEAKELALAIVRKNPGQWFDEPKPPTYSVDETSDVEELDGTEYASATL
ncbi:hypothetical protein O8B39_17250 [Agrobacterium rhizogenes]|nr:hypothetical protein [Rhizobium rhizogenes]